MKSIRTDLRNHAAEGDERIRTAVCAPGALVAYVPHGTTRCPDCGRDLIRTASGKRLCAYAEDHKSGTPIFARAEADRG